MWELDRELSAFGGKEFDSYSPLSGRGILPAIKLLVIALVQLSKRKRGSGHSLLIIISELGSASVEEYFANGAPVPSIRPDAERRGTWSAFIPQVRLLLLRKIENGIDLLDLP